MIVLALVAFHRLADRAPTRKEAHRMKALLDQGYTGEDAAHAVWRE